MTGSVWQRLLGALAHDIRRCQLDAEACVGGRLQQLPCDERAVRGALFYACRWFQQCKQKRAPTPCSPIVSLSLAACDSLLLVATTRHARYVCSCVMECSSSSDRQRNAPRAVEPGTSLMARQRTLFFAHDKIAQQSKSARRWRAAVAAAGQGWNVAICV